VRFWRWPEWEKFFPEEAAFIFMAGKRKGISGMRFLPPFRA
jgi:hypothetical protein